MRGGSGGVADVRGGSGGVADVRVAGSAGGAEGCSCTASITTAEDRTAAKAPLLPVGRGGPLCARSVLEVDFTAAAPGSLRGGSFDGEAAIGAMSAGVSVSAGAALTGSGGALGAAAGSSYAGNPSPVQTRCISSFA